RLCHARREEEGTSRLSRGSGPDWTDGTGTGSANLVVVSVHCTTASLQAASALSGRGRRSLRLAS
ncbi:MAG: hypothetical protein AAGJ80_04185, partial [Cyanobacteria bacterium J06553_1]